MVVVVVRSSSINVTHNCHWCKDTPEMVECRLIDQFKQN